MDKKKIERKMKRNRLTPRGFTRFNSLGIRPLNKSDQ